LGGRGATGGYPYQFFYYSAFGESLVQQDANTGHFAAPYRFNAKEQDPETGNYYYGARYYNPQTSIWFGVDPLAAKYPHVTPYNFVMNNPVIFIDPDGQEPITGALIAALLEVGSQVAINYFDKGMSFKRSVNSINRADVAIEAGMGALTGLLDPGIGKLAKWISKKRNRRVISLLFEKALEITADALTEMGKSMLKDEEFDAGVLIVDAFEKMIEQAF
jgi:RHS repeat-associated protein